MKALHVVHRVCHYIALWLFVAVAAYVILIALPSAAVSAYSTVVALEEAGETVAFEDFAFYLATYASAVGVIPFLLFIVAVVHLVADILFRQLRDLVKHNKEKKGCCSCGCGEVKSDLDSQVAEVLKWKNLYVEGVITEREFIDKRNEILRIAR